MRMPSVTFAYVKIEVEVGEYAGPPVGGWLLPKLSHRQPRVPAVKASGRVGSGKLRKKRRDLVPSARTHSRCQKQWACDALQPDIRHSLGLAF